MAARRLPIPSSRQRTSKTRYLRLSVHEDDNTMPRESGLDGRGYNDTCGFRFDEARRRSICASAVGKVLESTVIRPVVYNEFQHQNGDIYR